MLYSDLLMDAQDLAPEFAYVVTPGSGFKPQAFRYLDYAAYYRRVRNSLERATLSGADRELYPEPRPHCEICRWRRHCDAKWRADDHLSLVAGITKSQIRELRTHDISTVASFATVPLPLPWKPERGSAHSLERMREQARLQMQGRANGAVIFETLPPCLASGSRAYLSRRTGISFWISRAIRSLTRAGWSFFLVTPSGTPPVLRPISRLGANPSAIGTSCQLAGGTAWPRRDYDERQCRFAIFQEVATRLRRSRSCIGADRSRRTPSRFSARWSTSIDDCVCLQRRFRSLTLGLIASKTSAYQRPCILGSQPRSLRVVNLDHVRRQHSRNHCPGSRFFWLAYFPSV
jgi:hypothetical protein